MFDRPRNWKWMVPAALVAPCLVWWNDWWMAGGMWAELAMIPLAIAIVMVVAAIVNLYLYVMDHQADIYANVQTARNATPEVRMMEAARGMHPEAVKALLVHRRTIWRIKYVARKELVDWVLDDAPTVHAGFVDFVLDHSNGVSLMPKRFLAEGSTRFDPDGQVTDYEQYDDLLLMMQQRLMITQAYGNQAPHFLPPWDVAGLRKRFGLTGTEEYEIEKDEPPLSPSAVTSPPVTEEPRDPVGEGEVSNVIEKALEGLQQTRAMKAATERLWKK